MLSAMKMHLKTGSRAVIFLIKLASGHQWFCSQSVACAECYFEFISVGKKKKLLKLCQIGGLCHDGISAERGWTLPVWKSLSYTLYSHARCETGQKMYGPVRLWGHCSVWFLHNGENTRLNFIFIYFEIQRTVAHRHSINCLRSRSNLKENKRQYVNKTKHTRLLWSSFLNLTEYCSTSQVMNTRGELVIGLALNCLITGTHQALLNNL